MAQESELRAQVRSNYVLKPRLPGTEFFDAETERQKSPLKRANVNRDQNPGREGRKSPQKRPIWRRIGNVRFAETGWWAHQGSNLGPDD
jgi:hypothetical protein